MIVTDLNYLECAPEVICYLSGGFASVGINVFGSAIGEFTSTNAQSQTLAGSLPYGGSYAVGYGQVVVIGYTPPSFPSQVNYWGR